MRCAGKDNTFVTWLARKPDRSRKLCTVEAVERELHMKLDIVRAWEDESYRQYSEIELSDAQLQSIYGGGGYGGGGPVPGSPGLGGGPVGGPVPFGGGPVPFGGGVGFGVGVAHSGSFASSEDVHSFSVLCDINVFSLNVSVLNIISIATSATQICLNRD